MPTASKKKSSKATTTPPVRTSTSTPATPTASTSGAATTTSVVQSTAPPDVVLPVLPIGFVPVNLDDYRGSHPKAGQITAVPDVVAELQSSTVYEQAFGAAVPSANQLAEDLATAARWTALRVALEAFLLYVKSLEAITWKSGLIDLEKLNAVFQILLAQNPVLAAEFPALKRMLDVPKVIGQRALATRVRNAKAKKAQATATPAAAPVTPATSGTTGSGGTGGALH